MNITLKRRLVALGLSLTMASGTFSWNAVPNTAIVLAKSSNTYKVNSYGILRSYSGSSNVYIRANVSALTTTVFDKTEVTSFSVDSNNKYFKSVDGVLYTKDGKKLVRYPSGKKGSFVVPSTVTSIAQDAFRNCNVTSIQIPESVSLIGNGAFYGCKKLETIRIPSKITALRKNIFYGCSSLKNITLPSKLETIGNSAFYGCHSLEAISLPSSINKIGTYVFMNCKALTKITIPNKLKSIPSYTFRNCTSLTSITFGANVETIGRSAFEHCTALKSVTIPGTIEQIGTSAFQNCTSLQKVTFKSGLSTIQSSAFLNCTSLESVSLPNSVDTVSFYAFKNCTGLKKVTLSDKIRNIQTSVFQNCTKLETIHLPESLTTISMNAFFNCNSLKTIKIPKNVSYINNHAFINAGTAFSVDSGNSSYSSEDGVLYNKGKTKLIKYPSYKSGSYETPSSVTTIADSAFSFCHNIKNVTIGEGVKKLTKTCFSNSSIKKLSLPSTLKTLSKPNASMNAPDLENITIPNSNEYFTSEDGVLYTKDKTILSLYPAGKTGKVTFPAEAADLNNIETENKATAFAVTSGSAIYAASDGMLTNLKKSKIYAVPSAKTSYKLGSNIQNIDALTTAKYTMDNIKKITVSAKNSKFSAKNGVLFNKNKTKIVFYPNAKTGAYKVPSTVTSIDASALSYAKKLTKLTLTKNISKCTLFLTDCSALKTILLQEGSLRNFSISTTGTTEIKKISLPTSLISAKVSCTQAKAKKLTVVGWTNTCADKLAKKLNAKFVSVGLIPKQLKNVTVKAYVNLKMVKISWKKDPQVSGYEIYSKTKKIKTINNNNTTEVSIYVGDSYNSTLYIRSYKIQNGKKIYGTAKKLTYSPYL